jgi:hypothetical protein
LQQGSNGSGFSKYRRDSSSPDIDAMESDYAVYAARRDAPSRRAVPVKYQDPSEDEFEDDERDVDSQSDVQLIPYARTVPASAPQRMATVTPKFENTPSFAAPVLAMPPLLDASGLIALPPFEDFAVAPKV